MKINLSRQTKAYERKQLDAFVLTYGSLNDTTKVIERIADKEKEAYDKLMQNKFGVKEPLIPTTENLKQVQKTVHSLHDKVIKVLEEGLDDPEERYQIALGVAKYLFPQHRAVTGKMDNEVRIVFENLDSNKSLPPPPIKITPVETAEFTTIPNQLPINND